MSVSLCAFGYSKHRHDIIINRTTLRKQIFIIIYNATMHAFGCNIYEINFFTIKL